MSSEPQPLLSLLHPRQGIFAALVAITREVGAVGKGRHAKEGDRGAQYNFRGYDDVVNALHPLFAEHGVVVIPRDVSIEWDKTPRGGSQWRHYLLTVEFRFIAEDGSELTTEVIGEGLDGSDKGLGKARSYALREALTRMFTLPTNDPAQDNEAHTVPDEASVEMVPRAKAKGELVGALNGDASRAADLWSFGESRFVSRDELDDLLEQVKTSPPGEGDRPRQPKEQTASTVDSDGGSEPSPVPTGDRTPDEGEGQSPDTSPSEGGPAAARAALKGKKP